MELPVRRNTRSKNAISAPRLKGRFCKYKPETSATRLKTAKRKTYNARRELLSGQIYDKYISLFFLKGADEDWIPGSSCSGPLVELAESLIKPSYLPTRSKRSFKQKLLFFGGKEEDIRPLKTITIRDAGCVAEVPARVLRFKGRRFPRLANQTLEIEPVQEWLNELHRLGALRCKSVDAAFALCLETIKSYVMVSGKPAYIGFPKKKPISVSTVEEPPRYERSSSNTLSPSAVTNVHHANEHGDGEGMRGYQVEGSETPDEVQGDASIDEDEFENEENAIDELNAMALDDNTYLVSHLILEDDPDIDLTLACSFFLKQHRGKRGMMPPLLKEMLTYKQWKTYSIRDPVIHIERKRKLTKIAESLTLLREYHGKCGIDELKSQYLDLHWRTS